MRSQTIWLAIRTLRRKQPDFARSKSLSLGRWVGFGGQGGQVTASGLVRSEGASLRRKRLDLRVPNLPALVVVQGFGVEGTGHGSEGASA